MAIYHQNIQGPDAGKTTQAAGNLAQTLMQLRRQRANREYMERQQQHMESQAVEDKRRWDVENEREGERHDSQNALRRAQSELAGSQQQAAKDKAEREEQARRQTAEEMARGQIASGDKSAADLTMQRAGATAQKPTQYRMAPIGVGKQSMGNVAIDSVQKDAWAPGDARSYEYDDGQTPTLDPTRIHQIKREAANREEQQLRDARAERATALFPIASSEVNPITGAEIPADERDAAAAQSAQNFFVETGDMKAAQKEYHDRLKDFYGADKASAVLLKAKRKGKGGFAAGRRYGRSEVTGKTASTAERKADAFALRMAKQRNIIQDKGGLSEDGARKVREYLSRSELWGHDTLENVGFIDTLRESLSPADRSVLDAYKEFGAAELRLESGAAIGKDEFKSLFERTIPDVGDSEADRAQKMGVMDDMIRGVAGQTHRPSHYERQMSGSGKPTGPGGKPRKRPTEPPPMDADLGSMDDDDFLSAAGGGQ